MDGAALTYLGNRHRQVTQLQLRRECGGCRPRSGGGYVRQARFLVQVEPRRDGSNDYRSGSRLGHRADRQSPGRTHRTLWLRRGEGTLFKSEAHRMAPSRSRSALAISCTGGYKRRLRGHRPTVLRQRHVLRAVRLLLRLAQANGGTLIPGEFARLSDRQGPRGRCEPVPSSRDRSRRHEARRPRLSGADGRHLH